MHEALLTRWRLAMATQVAASGPARGPAAGSMPTSVPALTWAPALALSLAVAWLLAWPAGPAAAQAVPAPPPADGMAAAALPVTEVAPGVFVQFGAQEDWGPQNSGNVSNAAFIVGSRCVAVVDTGGSPAVGQRLKATIAATTPLPVCVVINTHVHPDHLLGNSAFSAGSAAAGGPGAVAGPAAAGPSFIGHARLPAALSARERYLRNALRRDFGLPAGDGTIVYPTRTVAEATDIDLGGRVLRLQPWPTAHTDHDLTVLDVSTRTLFTGDLVFVGHMPVVDGNLRGWIKVMDGLRAIDAAVVVPGHGPVDRQWPASMAAQADYLNSLLTETRAAIKAGLTIQQAVDQVGKTAARPWLLADLFHARNVTAAFAELEWED